jgi:5-oxoprolinase (ATP-hydrolysing)
VEQQGIPASAITLVRTAHIRIHGAHQSLPIAYDDAVSMRQAFVEAHRQRYGYAPEESELVLEIIASEAISHAEKPSIGAICRHDNPTESSPQTVPMYADGQWKHVPLITRSSWDGTPVNGPAMIMEATGTNMIAPGWQVTRDNNGNLIMRRYLPRPHTTAVGTQAVDPVMLEVFNNP